MRQTVDEMLHHQAQITANLKLWVVDKDIPLDERWDVFIKSGLGTKDSWITRFDSLGQDYFMYDGEYHCERYQTIHMDNVWERMTDDTRLYLTEFSDTLKPEVAAKLDPFREEVLEKFIQSFYYDW